MSTSGEFERLLEIMDRIRKECPWDKEQTHQSLRQYLIEEAYEVVESIDNEDWSHLRKELGDVLLQIVFHAKISEERDIFNINDVIFMLNEKLVRRHPHVFGDVMAEDPETVKKNWEAIKKDEEGKASYLDGVPKEMPALLRAQNLQRKAAAIGFDWDNIEQIWPKLEEETDEIHQAIDENDRKNIEEELGDILFSWVNLARHLSLNAEDALRISAEKFERRFRQIEKIAEAEEKDLKNMNLESLDVLWNRVKAEGH